jgi:HSP20 family protein
MFMLTRPSTRVSDFSTAFNRLSRLMDEAFAAPYTNADGDSLVGTWLPPVDVVEDKDYVRVSAELPGIRPEDVKIQLENNILTIRGEKMQQQRNEGERAQRYERVYGAFERSFTVPNTVDAEKIEASYEHGVLTVTLPKIERAKPRAISISVANGSETRRLNK